ncbi:helix-turn-helix domain-containing protein [Pseudomonas fluorescens]|uniref:helix-turn-helix domain-containing protein n=1 Tax=Pseudomonas TaxID=286 RepID=UPI003D07189E
MTDQKNGQPNKASHENTHVENTSNDAQLARLVPRLRQGPADTFAIMRDLNICRPGARICDLRNAGYKIITNRITMTDEWGRIHRGVAVYTLISEPGAKVAA